MEEEEPVNERDEQVFQDFINHLEEDARSLGLYIQEAQGIRQPLERYVLVGADQAVKPFVAAKFIIGDEAFSDRVQHPEKYSDETIIAQIEHATYEDEAERILTRFLEEGELFGE